MKTGEIEMGKYPCFSLKRVQGCARRIGETYSITNNKKLNFI